MLQDIDLRELSEVCGNGRDVLSAYFCGTDGLRQLGAREQQIRDLLVDDDLELENFEASLSNLKDLVADADLDEYAGVCAFSSVILDCLRAYPISMEVPNRLVVGPAPFIRPLAELQDEYETFLVVACDNDRTRLVTVTNHKSEVETAIKGGVKNHVRKGGWSQQRYERRRDEQLGRYGEEVADAINEIVRDHQIHRLVMAGSDETIRSIEAHLSDPVQELIVGREPFDLNRPDDELIELAYDDYFADERQDEQDLWQRIKSETLSDNRGCTGAAETLAAAKSGRVEIAIATRDVKLPASQCRDCEDVVAQTANRCPSCDSKNVFDVDYVDALARQLELSSASLNFVDEIAPLAKVGNVGALLRY